MIDRRGLIAGALAAVPMAKLAALAPDRFAPDRFAAVDPEMVAELRRRPEMTVTAANLDAFRHRRGVAPLRPPPPSPLSAKPPVERIVPGLPGQPAVRTVQYDGAPGRKGRGAVVWIHGGGYVSGGASIPGALAAAAEAHGWLIVSVDYRLAPEARQPQSLADNYAALRWVHDHAAELGIDRTRIAIGGGSAGGGHAAMLALAARDRGEVRLAYQVLIYPMLDDRTGSTRAARPGTGEFIWTPAANRFGWTALLGVPAGSARVPANVVPARRADLAGLPPAFIGVGTLDLFLDEDLAYAGALTAAGVSVDLAVVPGAYHAFDGVAPWARASQAFTARWIDDLTRALS
ncbi:alpha/beta hydrolase [Sphingomonas sp. MA1305]|uniref:alpha/beta hydrolase n=1 Tax=Sphingomonas sp. MA1305 TaxID=2479204 RepID=UPI001E53B3C2|nr:alpha/beta hydrolase [Sphingomonas sp. MA1305]